MLQSNGLSCPSKAGTDKREGSDLSSSRMGNVDIGLKKNKINKTALLHQQSNPGVQEGGKGQQQKVMFSPDKLSPSRGQTFSGSSSPADKRGKAEIKVRGLMVRLGEEPPALSRTLEQS